MIYSPKGPLLLPSHWRLSNIQTSQDTNTQSTAQLPYLATQPAKDSLKVTSFLPFPHSLLILRTPPSPVNSLGVGNQLQLCCFSSLPTSSRRWCLLGWLMSALKARSKLTAHLTWYNFPDSTLEAPLEVGIPTSELSSPLVHFRCPFWPSQQVPSPLEQAGKVGSQVPASDTAGLLSPQVSLTPSYPCQVTAWGK